MNYTDLTILASYLTPQFPGCAIHFEPVVNLNSTEFLNEIAHASIATGTINAFSLYQTSPFTLLLIINSLITILHVFSKLDWQYINSI